MAGVVPLPALPYGATPGSTYVVLRREAGRRRERAGERVGGRAGERVAYLNTSTSLTLSFSSLPPRPIAFVL